MTTTSPASSTGRNPELLGQTVVLIGGSAGIGLATARRARAEGAEVVLTGRNAERLENAGREIGASPAVTAGEDRCRRVAGQRAG